MDGMSELPDLELRIEELVLHGFHPGDRDAIAAAVESELTVLLAGDVLSGPLGAIDMESASIEVPRDVTPQAVGRQIARAIHGGLTSAGPPSPPGPPR
jgi:hypothetical protein